MIRDIRFEGNRVTHPDVMLLEMVVRPGDRADPAAIEQSRQNIMNLGLFQYVRTKMLDDGTLLVTVKEKRYLIAYPLLSRDDNGISPGIRVRWDNIGGMNHELSFRYKRPEASEAGSGNDRVYRLKFSNPRLAGSFIGLNVDVGIDRMPVETTSGSVVTSRYRRDQVSLDVGLSRWLHQPGPSRGWRFGGGIRVVDRRYTYESGTVGVFSDQTDVALRLYAGNTRVDDHLYSRTGIEYGFEALFGLHGLGSDFGYNRVELYYRRYRWLGAPHHNLNLQLRAGLADGGTFRDPPFSIGSARTLRGYADLEGEAYLLANIEYLRPLFGRPALRGVLFVDIGAAWPRVRDIDLSELKAAIGVGIRFRIKRFVRLDLRVDMAWNTDTGETEVYAGTRNTF